MQKLSILLGVFSCITFHVNAQVNVTPTIWMPKQYLEARKVHNAKDDFWESANLPEYLSPVASLRVREGKTFMQLYGADNFPVTISNTITTPDRTEWVVEKHAFNGGQAAYYNNATFSLISHNNDQQDLWLGVRYPDGHKDSIQFEPASQAVLESPVHMHETNYLTYLFKGKRFDIYDQQSHLLYSNVLLTKDGTINGLPGFAEWNIFKGNTLQLIEQGTGTIGYANYTILIAGEAITLEPTKARGNMNQKLVLKEKLSS